MCIGSNCSFIQEHKLGIFTRKPIKRTRVRLLRLTSRRNNKQQKGKVGKDMVMKNLKLYMKNISIREENEKLRNKACLLHQENLALMSEFRKRFSNNCDVGSITINLTNEQC